MDELTDIYKRIEYLRNNGVKMKEIADRVDMAPSVLSALYSSVIGEAVASGDGTGRAERGGEWQLFYQVAGERGEGVCAGGV